MLQVLPVAEELSGFRVARQRLDGGVREDEVRCVLLGVVLPMVMEDLRNKYSCAPATRIGSVSVAPKWRNSKGSGEC